MTTRNASSIIPAFILMAMTVLFIAGCASSHYPVLKDETPDLSAYTVKAGDEVSISVFGEPDLSGRFVIDETGMISFPLAGQVDLQGKTARKAEQAIRNILLGGYLKNPQVSVAVLKYEPVSVMGEVSSPGRYNYEPNLTILKTIAASGGFSYRANEEDIVIIRNGKHYSATKEQKVMPGDIIIVKERFL